MAPLNYHHLLYFRAVAREGNLTRAAAALNLSQSALSAQVRQLEARLGQALFERRGRTLHLTEAGRIALDHADAVATAGEELVATLREAEQREATVRVGALATLSRNFQLALLSPLIGKGVRLILRSGTMAELMSALDALTLDLIVVNQPPGEIPRGLTAHRLAEETVSLVGTPAYVRPGETLTETLARAPLLVPSATSTIRVSLDGLIARLGLQPAIAAEVDDMAMLRLLAREGAGLAVIPPIVVRDEVSAGTLVEAHALPGLSETFYAMSRERRFPNPHAQALLSPLIKAAPAEVFAEATAR